MGVTFIDMDGGDIRRMREAVGLRQVELAEILGVRHETVSRWETGKIGVSSFVAAAIERGLKDYGAIAEIKRVRKVAARARARERRRRGWEG